MGQATGLSLSFRRQDKLPDVNRRAAWRGCSAEFVRMSQSSDYAFALSSGDHYLALHDIVLADGRMIVDSLDPVRSTDIRGTLTYAPPGCAISGWATPAERTNAFTALYFDPVEMVRETEGLFQSGDNRPILYFESPGLISTMERLQWLLADDQSEAEPILAETLALLVAVELSRLQAGGLVEERKLADVGDSSMALVRDYVEDNLARDITLDDMAGIAGLSRYHFLRVFKSTVGETPYRFVMLRRAERAKEMLRQSELPVAEIAVATGFQTASRFVRSFRELTGTTPGAWRRDQA